MTDQEQLAISNCDKEPVHIPGRIQSFGAIVGFDLESGEILHHSENLSSLIFGGRALSSGMTFEDFVDYRELVHAVRSAIGLPTIRTQRERIGRFEIGKNQIDASVYVSENLAIVEFERDNRNANQRPQSTVSMVRSLNSRISVGMGLETLLSTSVASLRHLTGHDRVMAYRFLENGDGEVVAESCGPGIDPFLGLRYPASDIPMQVRQIMVRSPFRVIHDIHAEHSPLISKAGAPTLDMTFSHYRGVSPIHVEYLENMGVCSTMNMSIVVRGKLWGLFAFHHYRPRMLTPDHRSICELYGNLTSMTIQQEEERERLARRNRTRSVIAMIAEESTTPEQILSRQGDEIMSLLGCHGIGFVNADEVFRVGELPSDDAVRKICSLSLDDTVVIESIGSTTALSHLDQLGRAAGALLLQISHDSHLAFFRNEKRYEIRWAGEKEKKITHGPNGPRLSPRASFEEYIESVAGQSSPWKADDIEIATDIRRELMKSMFAWSSESTQLWERQKKYQDLLIAELNHRVRNTLALARSIARQTFDPSTTLEQYIESFEQRIAALSMAHDLVGESGLQWARIEDLVGSELKPFDLNDGRISFSGSAIAIRADIAPIVSLLFHELTSNAVKYGALSENGESLSVRWYEDDGGVSIEWLESLKVSVERPDRTGFGFALIERAIPYECDGRSTIELQGKQLNAKFWLPTKSVHQLPEIVSKPRAKPPEISLSHVRFDCFQSVLIVEDNLVLAMELENTFAELGISTIFASPNTELALQALERQTFECAILDINLSGETSIDLAIELKKRGTPLILASGYDEKLELPDELASVPRLTKPFSKSDVAFALNQLIQKE